MEPVTAGAGLDGCTVHRASSNRLGTVDGFSSRSGFVFFLHGMLSDCFFQPDFAFVGAELTVWALQNSHFDACYEEAWWIVGSFTLLLLLLDVTSYIILHSYHATVAPLL